MICRPEPEASHLAEAFRKAGADARVMPMMAREPLPETPPEQRGILQQLDNFSHIIAVSPPYAARRLMEEIDTGGLNFPPACNGTEWAPAPPRSFANMA